MKNINKNTINAIQKRLDNGETQFFIGAYWYDCNINGMIRRCEQQPGRTPTSDYELIGHWDTINWQIID